jgi:type VI secretion system protein VasD
MSTTVFKALVAILLGWSLAGCGAIQRVSDGAASATRSVFYKQVNTLHLDFDGRVALNTDAQDMSGLSVPTLLRIYQLSDATSVSTARYDDLLRDGDHVLGDALLDQRTVVVKPGEGAQLSMPLDSRAQAVAVVALFRSPDLDANRWRLTLTRDDLDPDRPRVIELGDNRLTLKATGEGRP